MRFQRGGSQNEFVYAVFDDDGKRLGRVAKMLDGTWFAMRVTGPRSGLVHSPGHKTRRDAAEALA